MDYVYSRDMSISFNCKGLVGYTFGPLKQQDLEIYYIDVQKGHDTFMISKKITRTYYILSGDGYFTIDGHRYNVNPGMLVEVPPKVEYSYSGTMKLVALSRPRWFSGNDTHTKWNPDVVHGDFPRLTSGRAWLSRLVRLRILGKSPINAYLRLNRPLWNRLPASITALGPIRSYGHFLHRLARIQGVRAQAFSTYFLRNRPQLELIGRLVERSAGAGILRVAVLGCSTGAEAYSVAWKIRSARPDLQLALQAVDISRDAVEIGKAGVYPLKTPQVTSSDIFERITAGEMGELFDRDGDVAIVKPWIRDGIEWHDGDVGDPEILNVLGPQDIVIANNFLCHMDPRTAERYLRNIARLMSPHGYLFASGVDLEVRTKVAVDLGWRPVLELLEEIHEGDPCMKTFWPWHYAGLEPLNKRTHDWKRRYAAAFELGPSSERVSDIGGLLTPDVSPAAPLQEESGRASAGV